MYLTGQLLYGREADARNVKSFDRWVSVSIPDPGSELSPSRIRIKDFKYFNPKKWFLSYRKYDPGCSSRIRMLTFYPSRIPDQKGTGSRILDSGSRIRIRNTAYIGSWFADLSSHELIPEKDKKEEGSPDTSEVDSNTDQVERRRSVRAKRDKVLHNYNFYSRLPCSLPP
jgi:hypothetical protein